MLRETNQNKAPVALFVYNRLNHTKQTIDALAKNDYSQETEIFVFSDGPKSEKDEENVNNVREYLETYECKHFKRFEIIKSDKNLGLAKSIILGVTRIMEQYGRIIVLEDDIITSSDFLKFMNLALDYFEDNNDVWSIAGYNPMPYLTFLSDVTWGYRAYCWGWASWKSRWDTIDWSVSTYDMLCHNKQLQRKFNKAGRDMFFLLELQMNNQIDSWAIRWNYQAFLNNQISIFPRETKCFNIGMDGSGTNCGAEKNRRRKIIIKDKWGMHYYKHDYALVLFVYCYYFYRYWRQRLGKLWYKLCGKM